MSPCISLYQKTIGELRTGSCRGILFGKRVYGQMNAPGKDLYTTPKTHFCWHKHTRRGQLCMVFGVFSMLRSRLHSNRRNIQTNVVEMMSDKDGANHML